MYPARERMSIEESFLGARDQSRVLLLGTLQCLFKSDVLIFILSVVIQTFSILTGFLGFELHAALKYWFVLKMLSRDKDSVVSLCFYFPLSVSNMVLKPTYIAVLGISETKSLHCNPR